MTIEQQIEEALREGRAIKAAYGNTYFFLILAASWALDADIRSIANGILNGYETRQEMAFDGYDLAVKALAANDQAVKNRALEVIYQVRDTCEI